MLALAGAAAWWFWPRGLSEEEMVLASLVICGDEYGAGSGTIRRFDEDVRVQVLGEPSERDLRVLRQVLGELDALIRIRKIEEVDSDPNFTVRFTPEASFAEHEPNYVPGNSGYCWADWNVAGGLASARILIANDLPEGSFRDHLIREEVTQCLGAFHDLPDKPDSIFDAGFGEATSYSEFDELVIRLLYHPRLHSGMKDDELYRLMKQWER